MNSSLEAAGLQPMRSVTIRLSESLYYQVNLRARRMQRSVEEEVVAVVEDALPALDALPTEIADEMGQMVFLTDHELWQALGPRRHLSKTGGCRRSCSNGSARDCLLRRRPKPNDWRNARSASCCCAHAQQRCSRNVAKTYQS